MPYRDHYDMLQFTPEEQIEGLLSLEPTHRVIIENLQGGVYLDEHGSQQQPTIKKLKDSGIITEDKEGFLSLTNTKYSEKQWEQARKAYDEFMNPPRQGIQKFLELLLYTDVKDIGK